MPAAKKSSIEPYKGCYVVMKEMACRKELSSLRCIRKARRRCKRWWRAWNGTWQRRPVHNRSGMTMEPPQRLDRFGYRYIARGLKIGGLRKLEDAAIWGLEHMFIVPEEG